MRQECELRPSVSGFFRDKITFHFSLVLFSLLAVFSAGGQSIDVPRTGWKVKSVDSVQSSQKGELVFDGDETTHWHTKWGAEAPLPHHIQIDLGGEYEVNGFQYMPRPDGGNGNIKDYEFHVSRDGANWQKVSDGSFANRDKLNTISFPAVPGVRYVQLVALSGFNGDPCYAAVAELYVMQKCDEAPEPAFTVPSQTVKTGHKLRFDDCSKFSPVSWGWLFPGGTPDKSTEQNPEVTYNKPGSYKVIQRVSNRNGNAVRVQSEFITVSDDVSNLACYLDGKDNDVRTGMKPLMGAWTLEAWIKGNDTSWNAEEVIFGAGEYPRVNRVDTKVLTLKKGRLTSTLAGISSKEALDDSWHHVAVSCDGKTTRLFLDGREIARADKAVVALPSCIGVDRENSTFGGLIDEVRMWETALPEATLQEWKGKPLTPAHPSFKSLVGYYPFDDMKEESSVNWVGRGHQAYHIRNGRIDYKGNQPAAYAVSCDNPHFKVPEDQPRQLFNAIVIPSEWDVEQGVKDDQQVKLRLAITGNGKPIKLHELRLNLSQTDDLKDIDRVHVYSTGASARSERKVELFGKGQSPARNMVFRAKTPAESLTLDPGLNYILVTFDINKKAVPGHRIKATIPSFSLNGVPHTPVADTDCVDKFVSRSSTSDPNTLKVLQWNIWHGGVHLADVGRDRVTDLIRASNADVVTMQEGYGAQEQIARELGYSLQTASSGDNLALFSRFPMEKIKTGKTFNSNPAIITLKNGRRVLVNDVWLRYAYRPEYASSYMQDGMNPDDWVKEDTQLAVEDAKYILSNDVDPHLATKDMPSLIGGDFNSGSHLDWTAAAAKLHNGYGPVALPCSLYMYSQGYKDSFREINPDEVARPEGTFAVIYGQLQHSRIDYIYYKGEGIKAISSKIVRTAPEIDSVWPSDHAAVLSVFEVQPDRSASRASK